MDDYKKIQQLVLSAGTNRPTRTGMPAMGTFAETFTFDMRGGYFPMVTTREVNFDAIIAELVAFIRGYTSAEDMRMLGTKIWDGNANGAGAPGSPNKWLTNPHRKGVDDLGPVYGAQWRRWESIKMVTIPDGEDDGPDARKYSAYIADGYVDVGVTSTGFGQRYFLRKEIDQLQDLIDGIKADPYGRRHVVSAWNPGVLNEIALPACHMMFQCYVSADGCIDLMMYQRSADLFLGVPFNIASYAALTHVIAALTGYKPGTLHMVFGDTHIYENAVIATLEQIRRTPKELPRLMFNTGWRPDNIAPDGDHLEVPVATTLDEITPHHFYLYGYDSHPAMKVKMAV